LKGHKAVLEFQPTFDPNKTGAFVQYQFNFFFAARGVSADTFVEASPNPVILDVRVRDVSPHDDD